MYSAVYADNPQAAAVVAETFDATEAREVLDIDEAAFRRDELKVALRGTLRVPVHARMQSGKVAGQDDEVEALTLAEAVVESLEPGHTYVLGAGTTMHEVKRALGVDGTLLGLDVVWVDEDGKPHLVVKDASERDLLEHATGLEIVVSPIGAQGFFLGRGNLPLTPAVLARLAIPGDVRVVATPWKLLMTPALKVDSGDPAIDARFPAFMPVTTGHGQTKLMRMAR
jgi:predicted polyphosphate/ATP-dependent NAD kinase